MIQMHTRRQWLWTIAAGTASVAYSAPKRPTFTLVVIVVGPPGSGKTTQSARLSKKYHIPSLSVADILTRKFGKNAPESLRASLASGTLLNEDAANQMMEERLLHPDSGSGFILDGYPTTEAQARFLDQVLQSHNLPAPKVVVLSAPDDVVRQRMLSRRQADDTPEMIEARLKEFHEDSGFLANWYKPADVLRIDATQPIAVVEQQIDAQLDDSLVKRGFTTRED